MIAGGNDNFAIIDSFYEDLSMVNRMGDEEIPDYLMISLTMMEVYLPDTDSLW